LTLIHSVKPSPHHASFSAIYAEVMACNKEALNHFLHRMLDAGVHLVPSAYEAGFVSAAHTAADVEETVRVASEASRRPRLARSPG
jgi:glutamate-1-semialdehyde 2,1-aminomutase